MLLAAIEDCEIPLLLAQEKKDSACFRLGIDAIPAEQCKTMFRFEKNDLRRLQTALNFPEENLVPNGTKTSGFEAFCIMLRRLAYPNRLIDLAPILGRSTSEISVIFSYAIDHVYNALGHLVQNLNNKFLRPADLQSYAARGTIK